jgi:hypothetical protein
MTAMSQSTRRNLSLLELAHELQNVSKACRIMGYHRDTFYEVRRASKWVGSRRWSSSGEGRGIHIRTE